MFQHDIWSGLFLIMIINVLPSALRSLAFTPLRSTF